MICPYCNKQVGDNNQFCPECGQKLTQQSAMNQASSDYWASVDRQNEAIENQRLESEAKITAQVRCAKQNITITCLLLAFIALAVVYVVVLRPTQIYNDAMELYNVGNFEDALEKFESLGSFRDSLQQVESCKTGIWEPKYQSALAFLNNKQYDQALELFEELGEYRDSQDLVLNTEYNKAIDYVGSGEYSLAAPILEGLKETKFVEKFSFLEDLTIIGSEVYTGNQGDSFVNALGTRNGYADIHGNEYKHGLEAWIARWNNNDEQSWAYTIFELPDSVNYLTGKCVLISCYNEENFDSTMEIYIDDTLVKSYHLLPSELPFDIDISFESAKQLKVYVYDNIAVSGGTSFGIVDAILINAPTN